MAMDIDGDSNTGEAAVNVDVKDHADGYSTTAPTASQQATHHGANTLASSATSSHELIYTLQGHQKGVTCISFSPSGLLLASASADSQLKLWSVSTGSLLRTYSAHSEGINDLTWSADSIYVATCSDDKSIKIFNVITHQLVRDFKEHTSFVLCLRFNAQSTLLVSGSFDETVRLWNVAGSRCHRTIAAHSEAVSSVDFNRDGTMIVSSGYDGLLRLWDTTTGQCLKTLVHKDQAPISHVQFSPGSAQLLCASLDSTIRLWDIYNSKIVKTYMGHVNTKFGIRAGFAVTKANAHTQHLTDRSDRVQAHDTTFVIVAGSEDHKIYFWDVQTKEIVQTIAAHTDAVIALSIHPTLPVVATAALEHDATVKLWLDVSRSQASQHGS